jgi:Ca-activated chloride channel family protein
MFTFGIGSAVNRHLLEGMARVGMGEPFVISKPEETREKAEKFRKMIESPVLTKVKLDFGEYVKAFHAVTGFGLGKRRMSLRERQN